MTYSADFRAQVIKSVKNQDMTIRQACILYSVSKTALQRWMKNPMIKQSRDKPPSKILNEVPLQDVVQYPDDYMYELAQRLSCSKSGIKIALKRLDISQKKDIRISKSLSNKKIYVSQ